MFGPGRHFPPAELREWERRERLDPEYQLSARPPSTAQPSPALPVSRLRPEKSERIFAKGGRREEEGAGRKREGKPEVQMFLGLAGSATQGFHLGSS